MCTLVQLNSRKHQTHSNCTPGGGSATAMRQERERPPLREPSLVGHRTAASRGLGTEGSWAGHPENDGPNQELLEEVTALGRRVPTGRNPSTYEPVSSLVEFSAAGGS